ncbi:Conserved hypothetical membrane protein [Brachyspira suanatina]|uniref:Conserved hypothetical membrane protein n=1 Tax=Brachyspira suanatina TaxID=381802 RepID=A0A0G4K9Y7_9SPIR|nr:hypothetical protein [Brachyspira suanatina]CRF35119.1 Conserved hypothetical membrane protein [Brachyspira suanatina]
MRIIKNIIIILIIKVFSLFAVDFIDFNLSIPIGGSYNFLNASINENNFVQTPSLLIPISSLKSGISFEIGVLAQLGYNFKLENSVLKSTSTMIDFGYYMYPMAINYNQNIFGNDEVKSTIIFHTINIGGIQKFYLGNNFAIGLGGGVKIPISYTFDNIESKLNNPLTQNNKGNLNYIKALYDSRVIPYIKLTLESFFFVHDNIALNIGMYISYSIGMNYNVYKLNEEVSSANNVQYTEYYNKLNSSSLGVGVVLGASFGRVNPKLQN